LVHKSVWVPAGRGQEYQLHAYRHKLDSKKNNYICNTLKPKHSSCLYIRVCTVRTHVQLGFGLHGSFHGITFHLVLPSGIVLLYYFEKKKRAQSAVHSHVAVCSSCCRRVVCLDIRVFRKKRDYVVVFWLQSATLHARVLKIVPHKANLFVNIGNVFGTNFFFL